MRLVVCPLVQAPALIQSMRPERVVSLLSPGQPGPRVLDRPHLRLDAHDVSVATPGLTLADADFVERLLAFASQPDWPACLLVHCAFAVSRSPAAAFVLACAARPSTPEAELAVRLRQTSPTCTPNRRIVELGDDRLGRGGRMVEAIAALGRGADYVAPLAFTLEV